MRGSSHIHIDQESAGSDLYAKAMGKNLLFSTETRCFHIQLVPKFSRESQGAYFSAVTLQVQDSASGDGEAGLWSHWGADTQTLKHHHSHALHFPGAEAVLLRGTGSLYAQLSLWVSIPQEAYMVVCSVWGGRHCNCKLPGRCLNHTESTLDLHALSGHVLIAVPIL